MSRTQILRTRLLALLQCFALIADLLGCALVSVFTGIWAVATMQEGASPCAFETLSARAGRAQLNRKLWGRAAAPAIDFLFRWQSPVAELPDGSVFEHPSHCLRAFIKTRHGAYLPREYHAPLPDSVEECYRWGWPND